MYNYNIYLCLFNKEMTMGRKKGVILSYVMMVFEVLSTLLITPFVIRTLGQTEYGVYKLSASVTAYLLLLDLGVGNAIVRYIAKYRANGDRGSERKFFGVSSIFYLSIALITLIVGSVLIYLFPTIFDTGLNVDEILLGQKLLSVTVINAAVTMGTAVYANIIIAYERFAVSKGLPIVQIILRMLLTVIALKVGVGSFGIVCINLLMTVLCRGFFVFYVLFVIKLRPQLKGTNFQFIKGIVVYSGWIFIQMIATQINASMDQILLGSLVSASASIIAVYSVGTQVVQYFQSIGGSFTGVLMPGIVRLVEQNASGKTICEEMVRIGRMILIVLGLVWSGFAAFGRQFIVLWAGAVNENAYYVSLLLMSAYLLVLVEAIGTQVLWAKNEHKEQAILKLAVVLLNVVLTVMLIRWNPLIGATVGTFISLVLGDIVVMNIVFAKKLKVSLKQYYSGLLKGLLISLLAVTLIGFFVNLLPLSGWFGLGLKILLVCVAYFLALWFYGMNATEKNLLRSLLKRIHFVKN